jgi:hypothetical protein
MPFCRSLTGEARGAGSVKHHCYLVGFDLFVSGQKVYQCLPAGLKIVAVNPAQVR